MIYLPVNVWGNNQTWILKHDHNNNLLIHFKMFVAQNLPGH